MEYSSIEQVKKHAPRLPPLLVAKAGLDEPWLNQLIDSFRDQAKASNLSLEYLEHPKGHHAFDIRDDDDTSREILRRTMSFIKRHLR
jgi:dienelactone hydrolase